MILFSKNNQVKLLNIRLADEPYHIINIILAGVIVLIMTYSGIFSPVKDNYPVTCIHEKISGEPCISCGLSHSFSLIIRGKISEAYEWNIYGIRVFLFFISQLVFRITFLIISVKFQDIRRQLIIYDIIVSSVIFLIAFCPFIKSIFQGLINI